MFLRHRSAPPSAAASARAFCVPPLLSCPRRGPALLPAPRGLGLDSIFLGEEAGVATWLSQRGQPWFLSFDGWGELRLGSRGEFPQARTAACVSQSEMSELCWLLSVMDGNFSLLFTWN